MSTIETTVHVEHGDGCSGCMNVVPLRDGTFEVRCCECGEVFGGGALKLSRDKELTVLRDLYSMCVPSLPPHEFEMLDHIAECLCETRRNLSKDDLQAIRREVGISAGPEQKKGVTS